MTDKAAWKVAHGGAVSRAGLLLVDLLIGVGGVEPAGPLLLLALGEGVLPQGWVDPVLVEFVEGRGRGRQLHVPPRPRALQEQGEAVGVAGAVALGYSSRGRGGQFWTGNAPTVCLLLMQTAHFIWMLYIKRTPFANRSKALTQSLRPSSRRAN